MNRSVIVPLALLLASIILWGCKDQDPPVVEQSFPEPPEDSLAEKYPRICEEGIDSGMEVQAASPIPVPVSAGVWNIIEERFLKHIEVYKTDNESSFGIQLDPRNSLMVRFSPNTADDSRTMLAIWRQVEKQEAGNKIVVRQSSQPLSGEKQALEILSSYASADDDFENMIEWTVE